MTRITEFIEYTVDETEEGGIEMSVSSDCSETDSAPESNPYGNDESKVREELTRKESKQVFRLRVVVILVLFCAAILVSVIVFHVTKSAQDDEFRSQYEGSAEKITEAFRGIVSQKLGAISAVGVAMIAHGVDHARSWPFVTLSSFQQRSSTARSLSGALFVSISPYVNQTHRSEWEKYVVSNDSYWIDEGFLFQKQLGLDEFEPNLERKNQRCLQDAAGDPVPSDPIYFIDGDKVVDDPGPGPYMVSHLEPMRAAFTAISVCIYQTNKPVFFLSACLADIPGAQAPFCEPKSIS